MNQVFVLSTTRQPLMPCSPARARRLLTARNAAVFRHQPFTIILTHRQTGETQPLTWQLDPGSRVSGLALVGTFPQQGRAVVWAGELHHRGRQITQRLLARRAWRRARRARHTRYRPARFANRRRPQGWLPPSLQSRVDHLMSWTRRLQSIAPLSAIAMELVRFDTQALVHPEIRGVAYQQGTLLGYEVREYLLDKWRRTCAYCQATNGPLEIEHLIPRSRGGSDRVSNLTLACPPCNQRKGRQTAQEYGFPELLAQAQRPLKDAAAVNSTRWALWRALHACGLPLTTGSGGRTKFNRVQQGYPKAHWIDAACVGEHGHAVQLDPATRPLTLTAIGRGRRQVVKTDRYGFPRTTAGRIKRVQGLQTGDWVKLVQPHGKYAGKWIGTLKGVRRTGQCDLQTARGRVTAPAARFTILQRTTGYAYAL